ncbi:MAG: leucine-rich repeat domain-containing protein [Gammaproteobacteria bacterium]|nr:leucine-rich repeat domain-containing protein [Gammaproteobacteria bacterium]
MNRRDAHQRRIKVHCGTALLGLLVLLTSAPRALALDPRDIVFECPCSAEWVAGADGQGKLELSFGLRSFRATESGDIVPGIVSVERNRFGSGDSIHYGSLNMGRMAGNSLVEGLQRTGPYEGPRPSRDWVIHVVLWESTNTSRVSDRYHEVLTLWPVPGADDADRIQYVDLLTDTDGDGVGDVNERIAGSNPDDPALMPGESTVDVLWLYDDGAPQDSIYARIHHLKTVSNLIYVDSGTNIRLRTVGIRRIEKADDRGWADHDHVTQLMDRHGADISHQIGYSLNPCSSAGCAGLGGVDRGHWSYLPSFAVSLAGPDTVAHELGHVMGLVHSARQGEAYGAFRWSRGHYLDRLPGRYHGQNPRTPIVLGTIMTYGAGYPRRSFSNPSADCNGEPCGVPGTEADGADARRSLDLLRFQVAAHRDAKPDSDGDGFVDDADAAPDDPTDWLDSDGDGLGDNADADDDGDGVDDVEDRWPLDPLEWEDLDGDGVGDNADDAVEVQGSLDPFRDAALRRVVEQALGKSAGDGISAEEMSGLQQLRVSADLGVRDLTGMELATGLTRLEISGNDLTDLSPLAGLTNLSYLSLRDNPITDLSPIAGLTSLQYLVLYDNPITDLSPIAGLTQLVRLEVENALVTDFSPLAGLTSLESLTLYRTQISDLSPLEGMTNLKYLWLLYGRIVDLSPLSGLTELNELSLVSNRISDVTPLSGLTNLQTLKLTQNSISNLTPLSGLQSLRELLLTANRIADLSPLQGLTSLETLGLGENRVTDLSPLSGLMRLKDLRLDVNRVTDLSPLAGLSALRRLWVDSNDVSDLSPLADLELDDLDIGRNDVSLDDVVALPGFANFRRLGLDGLGISDVRPLAGLSRLQRLSLNENGISDVSPLAVREIWSEDRSLLLLTGNPLDEASVAEHVPLLESWSVAVYHEELPAVNMPDTRLRSPVFQQTAGSVIYVDSGSLTKWRMERLYRLYAFNAGVSDLTGLEAAINLRTADFGSNAVSDLAPLSELDKLRDLNLKDNRVSDVSPLVGLNSLARVDLSGNPLTEESLNVHIPEMRDDGVSVEVESVEWEISSASETAKFEVKRYFESLLGSDLRFEADGDYYGLATVNIAEGVLEVSPRGDSGVLTTTVTATDGAGKSATLRFRIALILAVDDHGNDRALATDLTIGARIEAQIDYIGDRDWFRLSLSEPASVAIYTSGDLDTVGRLHDEYGALMVSDDDGGDNANFHIEGRRAEGAYYVRVDSDGNATGRYTLHARRYEDVVLPKAHHETVRLWATLGDGWTLDPGTDAPFLSGGTVASAAFGNRDAYVLRLGPDGRWRASPSAGVCEADLWTIKTLAGTRSAGNSGDGGPATEAQLNNPSGVAIDAAGNVYVADSDNHRIRRIGPDGVIVTIAGTGESGYSGDGGPATEAQLASPVGVAVGAAGNVYIAERRNHRIRRIGTDGTIETFAGTGESGYGGDGGPATEALLNYPRNMAIDAAGYLYIADWNNYRIRRIAPDRTIETFAGTGEPGVSGDGGPASQARISSPNGLAADASGNLYFTQNAIIRRIGPDGMIETIAGSGDSGYYNASGWPAESTRFENLKNLAVDSAGYVYFAAGKRILRITPDGIIETVWDMAPGYVIVGTGDNPPDFPAAVVVDASGQHVYFAQPHSHRVRVLTRSDDHGDEAVCATALELGMPAAGRIEAADDDGDDADWFRLELNEGSSVAIYTTGDLDTIGSLHDQTDEEIAWDDESGANAPDNFHIEGDRAAGVYYVRVESQGGEPGNYTLHARRYVDVSLGDTAETVRLWGTASGGWTLDRDTDEPFASGGEVEGSDGARFALMLGSDGAWSASPAAPPPPPPPPLESCDASLAGTIRTLGGTAGSSGHAGDGGLAVDARLHAPFDVAVDTGGYVYVPERLGHRIRRISPGGIIVTFAGTGVAGFGGDGGAATESQVNIPTGVAVDAAGYVYVADRRNHRIRRIARDGTIETFAGTGVRGFAGDGGPATDAQLNHPMGVTVDAVGNVYVADSDNHRVRRIGLGGTIETIAGTGSRGYGGDGGPATEAQLNWPFDVAADTNGAVYIADVLNRRIRRIATDGTIETFAGTGTAGYSGDGGAATEAQIDQPAGLAVSAAGYVFIADWGDHRIRRVAPSGIIETFAGTGVGGTGGDGGLAVEAQLARPSGVAVDASGNVYIADSGSHRVRVVELPDSCR